MKIKLIFILTAIWATLFAGAARAGARPEWQGDLSEFGFAEHGKPGAVMRCVGGLSLKLADGPEPVFYQEGVDGQEANSCVELAGESGFVNRMHCVGKFRAGAAGIEDMQKSWVRFSMTYMGCAVHVSRLTPAILLETEEKTLSFSNPPRPMDRVGALVQPDAFPVFFAYEDDGGEIHAGVLAPGEMEFPNLFGEKNVLWMLFWYGPVCGSTMLPLTIAKRWWHGQSMPLGWYKGDQPLLFVFSAPLKSMAVGRDGKSVEFRFSRPAGRIAVVQPYEKFYQLTDTSAWFNPQAADSGVDELPAPVAERCRAWSKRLQSFPLDVEESWESVGNGDVLIREKFEHLPLDPENAPEKVWLPAPPMWAVAQEEGFPIEFEQPLEDTGVYTLCGPYRGFYGSGEYTARIRDIEKYWRQRRVLARGSKPLPPAAAAIAKKLEHEIDKILEAGPLAPWIFVPGKGGACLRWNNPGETLYYLSLCSDFLPQDKQAALAGYLREMDKTWPPESALIPAAEGARRERGLAAYYKNEEFNLLQQKIFVYGAQASDNDLLGITPVQNLYYLAYAAEKMPSALARQPAERWAELKAIPEPYLQRLDWASGSFFWRGGFYFKYGEDMPMAGRGVSCGVIDQNYWFAGCVGLARLAETSGDEATRTFASYLVARAAITRVGMAAFVANLYRNGCQAITEEHGKKIIPGFGSCGAYDKPRFYGWSRPELDVRQALRMDQFTTVLEASMMLVMQPRTIIPFVGMVPELGRLLRDQGREPSLRFIRAVETMPNWFLAWTEDSWGREQGFELPECSQQIFMAKSWIEDTPAEKLAELVDVSWTARGDLYYLQKLTETLAAFYGSEWK